MFVSSLYYWAICVVLSGIGGGKKCLNGQIAPLNRRLAHFGKFVTMEGVFYCFGVIMTDKQRSPDDYPRGDVTMDRLDKIEQILKSLIESNAESKAEADERSAEADKRATKADKERAELRAQLKRTDILVGRMDNRFGDLAESMLVGDVAETLKTIDNLRLEHSFYNAQSRNGNDSNRVECEIDALLVGQNSIVVMEAKSTLTTDKIEKFIETRLNRFTELFPIFADKKIYGAVGYLKAVENAVEFAMNEGLLVVRSTLQTKEILNSKTFQPKDYNPNH